MPLTAVLNIRHLLEDVEFWRNVHVGILILNTHVSPLTETFESNLTSYSCSHPLLSLRTRQGTSHVVFDGVGGDHFGVFIKSRYLFYIPESSLKLILSSRKHPYRLSGHFFVLVHGTSYIGYGFSFPEHFCLIAQRSALSS